MSSRRKRASGIQKTHRYGLKTRRKFNGKIFEFMGTAQNKAQARRFAKAWKREGANVRITKSPKYLSTVGKYEVWYD